MLFIFFKINLIFVYIITLKKTTYTSYNVIDSVNHSFTEKIHNVIYLLNKQVVFMFKLGASYSINCTSVVKWSERVYQSMGGQKLHENHTLGLDFPVIKAEKSNFIYRS